MRQWNRDPYANPTILQVVILLLFLLLAMIVGGVD